MIRFACPGCSAVLDVPDKAIGKKGRCPKCGQRLQIPSAPSSPRDRTVLGINASVESDFPISSAGEDWRQANADASTAERPSAWMDSDDGPAKMPKGTKITIISLGVGVLAIVFIAIMVIVKAKQIASPLSPLSPLTEVDRNALLLADAGEWKKAFSVIERAITDEPSRASHWYTRGGLHFKWGNYPEAMHDFDTALRLAPDWQEAQKMRGLAEQGYQRERRERELAEQEGQRVERNRKMEWVERNLRSEREWLASLEKSVRMLERERENTVGVPEVDKLLKEMSDDSLKSARESVRQCKERIRGLEDEYRRLKAGQ